MSLTEWISSNFYNDMNLLPFYLVVFSFSIFVLFAAIFFHELGHWLYFKIKLNKKVKIRYVFHNLFNMEWIVGEPGDYEGLSDKQYKRMLFFGLIMGVLPILFACYVFSWMFFLILPYLVGAKSDLKELIKDIKLEDE